MSYTTVAVQIPMEGMRYSQIFEDYYICRTDDIAIKLARFLADENDSL
jgi:hypothetical protein